MRLIAALLASTALALPPGLRGREISRLSTRARVVALSFDCGSDAGGGWAVLAALRRAHAPATFFMTGVWARRYPTLARQIGRFELVGNHTWDHHDLTRLSDAADAAEITRAEGEIRRATGQDPRPLFRFPYGARDTRTIAVANRLGYADVYWTVDTLGWMEESESGIVRRVLASLEPGEIVLMHVGSRSSDPRALRAVLSAIRARGYRFVTLSALRR